MNSLTVTDSHVMTIQQLTVGSFQRVRLCITSILHSWILAADAPAVM